MIFSVLNKATSASVYPYPHIVIEDALDKDLYDHLKKTRPEVPHDGSNNKRFDIRAKDLLEMDIDPQWKEFIHYHTSDDFYQEVSNYFFLPKGSTGVRFRDKADILMECQMSINSPVTEESQVCIAHLDNPQTLWAGLLYMPDDDDDAGGNLEIYDCQEPEIFGKRRVGNPGEPYKIVPYKANTFVCFKNSPISVHAPQARKVTNKIRKFCNFGIDAAN